MSANYDIPAEQGSDFFLHIRYLDEDDNPVDLSDYTAEMQVRRSYEMDGVLAFFTSDPCGATIGNTFGYGGITLNCSYDGVTGYTGGVFITATGTGMSNMPIGKFVYDLRILGITGNNVVRMLEGRFDSSPRVTR